jgi:hypothetical protein
MAVAKPATILERVDAYLATVVLDEAAATNAAIAQTLAVKLDQCRTDSTGAQAMAAPAIAKELRATLAEVVNATSDHAEFVAGLFGGDDD